MIYLFMAMHLYISNSPSVGFVPTAVVESTVGVVYAAPVQHTTTMQYTYRERTVTRGRFRSPTVTYELVPVVPATPLTIPQPLPPTKESPPAPPVVYTAPTATGCATACGQCATGRTTIRERSTIRFR